MAQDTKPLLLEAGLTVFAEQGIANASMVEVVRRAGQANRAAVHYHFGGRDGLLVAVLGLYADFLAGREAELLERARSVEGLAAVVEAVVRPAAELARSGDRGRAYLAIVGELVERDQASWTPEVAAALTATGGYEVYDELARRMPAMDEDLRNERFALMTTFILGSVARAYRDPAHGGRPPLDRDRFVENLVAMAAGMLAAPS